MCQTEDETCNLSMAFHEIGIVWILKLELVRIKQPENAHIAYFDMTMSLLTNV